MDEEREAIIEKYKRNVDNLIRKYQNYEEDSIDVIDVFNYCEQPTIYIDSISFIKSSRSSLQSNNSTLLFFEDVYRMLCTECVFEDIYRFLR